MTFQTLELHYLYKADWNRSKKLLCYIGIYGVIDYIFHSRHFMPNCLSRAGGKNLVVSGWHYFCPNSFWYHFKFLSRSISRSLLFIVVSNFEIVALFS